MSPSRWNQAAGTQILERGLCYTRSKKGNVKCTLVQVLRFCTGRTAHRGSTGTALLFLDHGTRRGWGVSVTHHPIFTPRKDLVPIVQEVGWASGPIWTGAEILSPPGFDSRSVQPVASHYTDYATRQMRNKVTENAVELQLFLDIFFYEVYIYVFLCVCACVCACVCVCVYACACVHIGNYELLPVAQRIVSTNYRKHFRS